jgi:uncharacterized surface protein with fasciclin (FAS1) repeats
MSNITQVVNVDKNLKTLKKSMHATDLDQLLSSRGPFTIFAPSDIAFEKLEKGLIETLLEPQSRVKLSSLLSNHIFNGSIAFADLKDGNKLISINGKEQIIHVKNDTVTVGDTVVHVKVSKISNGTMHSADTVIV